MAKFTGGYFGALLWSQATTDPIVIVLICFYWIAQGPKARSAILRKVIQANFLIQKKGLGD
jgi:hypothetical protein